MPPLKFHSGLFKPLSTVSLSAQSDEDDSDYYNDDHDDEDESVGSASASHEICGNNSDDDAVDGPGIRAFEEDMLHFSASKKLNELKYRSTINRGLLKEDLRVEVERARRFTDGGWDSKGSSAVSGGSCRLNHRKEPNSAYVSGALIFSRK